MLDQVKLGKKLKHRQMIIEDLRKRFQTEYLGQLILKDEKKMKTRKIKIGDIVLIGDDNHKRIDWPLARVIEIIPGRDGQNRVFILKTKNGLLKRPIQRIYPLEIEQREEFIKNSGTSERIFEEPSNKKEYVKKRKNSDPKIVTTRSGRVIKTPDRLGY